MVQTWRSAPGGTYICPHCGASYEVTHTRLPARERDTADCEVCGQRMGEWSDTISRSFRLVSRPVARPAEDSEHG